MAEKKEKVEVQSSNYVTIVKGEQKLNVHKGTLASWEKNGYKVKDN